MTKRLPHNLRSDARDNRDRILDAARATFAEEGLDVSLREIARRAGVGAATLYRHFETKEALATAVLAERMAACAAVVDEGLADPDPWRGFRTVVEKVCALHAVDSGFTSAMLSTFPGAVDFAGFRERALRSADRLARRAVASGHLRPDFVLDDLIMVIMANSGIRATSREAAAAASRRFAALLIDSLHSGSRSTPLPPAVRLPITTAL
ncbi:TetR/AcrR family transcriptional regulator [Umezawaea endophytica]|uniref:TetR/AcrR family transcriptional regulator n=1 Tax=Umezawaea endophytica TaxID=1654476 RepID=A0A9X3AE31_9PSEU|nr:TetR/AcrR family transcriptional regulator [Umezawaea endophytica]MCS7476852.1 TetR/AcrR family transcriptional regulator [Umezawaea endophytica]